MKTISEQKPKRGRKPSGRKTSPVNVRMEVSLKQRLMVVSEKHKPRISQIALVEEGLDVVLPKYEANLVLG